MHKIKDVPEALLYKKIPRATKSHVSHVSNPHLTYFSHIFSFSVTCRHFEKTLIAASFLSSLINESQLNYETLFTFSQAATNIFKYFPHTPNKKTHINNLQFKMFCIKTQQQWTFWSQICSLAAAVTVKIIKLYCLVFDYLWGLMLDIKLNHEEITCFQIKNKFQSMRLIWWSL